MFNSQGVGGTNYPGNLNLGNASQSVFSWAGGTFTGNVNNESGLAFVCPNGNCMRISPNRYTAFLNAVRGTYELNAACDATTWEYRNNFGACVGNSIRRLTFSIVNAGGRYPVTAQLTGIGSCTGPITIANQGKAAWLEYQMSAEVCIVGDQGNSSAQGCTRPDDVRFCNCFPTTYTKSGNSGPCTYSGSCAATLTFNSFGSAFEAFGGFIPDQNGNTSSRAWWPDMSFAPGTSDSTTSQTDPRCTTNRFCAEGFIQFATARNGLNSGGFYYGTRDEASCYNVPQNIYFPMFSPSGVLNLFPGCSSALQYYHRDTLSFVAKALKRSP